MITAKTSKTLRGIAILIVIASHFAEWMFVEPAHPGIRHMVSTWGPPGVDIFLLLSGYGLYLSARREAERTGAPGGITGRFVLRRLLNGILPYYLVIGILYFFTGTWKQALQEGTLTHALRAYLTAADHWYIQVLIILYLAFILCFRFGARFRLPLLSAAVILHMILLANADHADFWTLSNGAFLIGVYAAALEKRFPEHLQSLRTRLAVLLAGAAGMTVTYLQMARLGGSGAPEAYGWELAMNLCFTVIVLGAAWLLKDLPGLILPLLGEHSLFIYLTHTSVFWLLIFKLEALASIILSIAAGTVYSLITKKLLSTSAR